MLQYQTIDNQTLELLKTLQKLPIFSNMRLAGGTSLALQTGHRKSIDIDLFGLLKTDEINILNSINKLGNVKTLSKSENIFIFLINNIKVDIVNYPYPWLKEPIIDNEIILADKADIAAMKLSAISGRGTKKDFIDLNYLLQSFSLEQIISFYNAKFYDGSEFIVLKSLSYFDDADNDPDPLMLKPYTWENTKKVIRNVVQDYLKKTNSY
jgi:hypothetical protein